MDRENPTHITFKRHNQGSEHWVCLDHNIDRFTDAEYLSVMRECVECIARLRIDEFARISKEATNA